MGNSIVILTHFPSPYQVELFDAVEELAPGRLQVFYLHRNDPSRNWSFQAPNHSAFFLKDGPEVFNHAHRAVKTVGLAVMNFYTERPMPGLIKAREGTGLPWSFWGERPGFRHPVLGRIVRRWKLRALHSSTMPIWGIGSWAVAAYQREFGKRRAYVNLPYFSDLTRFQAVIPRPAESEVVFLYSGSLSRRKGVDVLARAFARLAAEEPRARLRIMGEGELESSLRVQLLKYRDRVEWVGFKDWHDLPQFYAAAHALCVPSRYDGWGMIVAEGLASGLPVIGTDRTGAVLDLIEHGKNGMIVPADNEASLYLAMRQLCRLSSGDRETLSRTARASVKNHSLEEGAKRFIRAAQDALGSGAAT